MSQLGTWELPYSTHPSITSDVSFSPLHLPPSPLCYSSPSCPHLPLTTAVACCMRSHLPSIPPTLLPDRSLKRADLIMSWPGLSKALQKLPIALTIKNKIYTKVQKVTCGLDLCPSLLALAVGGPAPGDSIKLSRQFAPHPQTLP